VIKLAAVGLCYRCPSEASIAAPALKSANKRESIYNRSLFELVDVFGIDFGTYIFIFVGLASLCENVHIARSPLRALFLETTFSLRSRLGTTYN